ncbi:hypothetical protein AKJ41_02260 [candidate division MSBL1 archaeon SCGC-AAA259O05]|uniref:Serralysin n=1 Tax=candidate division MSBL1 archaeon SCGC-AAA259O05 TaxID=1698271 RepID=A0A133V459_9EURY|nr:hypothetical protein AKJ41_02260 [candidate division MSBL1 archaeon SCGC-AAA259O05]
MDVLSYLQEKSEIVDEEIDRLIPEDMKPEEFAESTRYLIEAGGKRLRPVLTLTAAEAVGGNSRKVVKSAAAMEILHTFTLVHDDIMDQDDFRRGAKTTHKVWNEAMAINAGDALFAKVFRALTENVKSEALSLDETVQLFDTISETSFEICQGQAMDLGFEKRKKVTESEYLKMVGKKTGALIEASTKTGAILGRGEPNEVKALADYGRLLGIAFQIHDDFLGVAGEQEKVGKPVGSDIREGKWTFLTVHAYEKASQEDRKDLQEVLGKSDATDEELDRVIEIFRRTGAIDFARSKSKDLVEQAKSKLDVIPDSESKDFLLELANFSVEREL